MSTTSVPSEAAARSRTVAISSGVPPRTVQPAHGRPGCGCPEASGPPGALPGTLGVFVVSGLEGVLIHVAAPDNQGLYAFVIDRLTERPEVADVRTSVVYEHMRNQRWLP
jgi:DNA-binding Lrp family transcriptional regulator